MKPPTQEAPKMMTLEELLTPEMLEKLRRLESFRDYETRIMSQAKAAAEAQVEVRLEAARAKAEARAKAADLKDFLIIRGDKPSRHAFKIISDCHSVDELDGWLKRAYLGETSAQLFPEPEQAARPSA